MTQTKFKAGDIVSITASSQLHRTVHSLRGDNQAEIIWEEPGSGALKTHVVSLNALRLAPHNPRTKIKAGDVVSFIDYLGTSRKMSVSSVNSQDDYNPNIICQWFVGNELHNDTFKHSQLEKVFHPFYALTVVVHQDDEVEEVYLGSYDTHEECVELMENFSNVMYLTDPAYTEEHCFAHPIWDGKEIRQIVFREKNVKHVYSTRLCNAG